MNSFFLKDSLGSLANIFKKQGINAFSNFYGKSIGTLGSVISSAAAGQGLPGLDMNDFVSIALECSTGLELQCQCGEVLSASFNVDSGIRRKRCARKCPRCHVHVV